MIESVLPIVRGVLSISTGSISIQEIKRTTSKRTCNTNATHELACKRCRNQYRWQRQTADKPLLRFNPYFTYLHTHKACTSWGNSAQPTQKHSPNRYTWRNMSGWRRSFLSELWEVKINPVKLRWKCEKIPKLHKSRRGNTSMHLRLKVYSYRRVSCWRFYRWHVWTSW